MKGPKEWVGYTFLMESNGYGIMRSSHLTFVEAQLYDWSITNPEVIIIRFGSGLHDSTKDAGMS